MANAAIAYTNLADLGSVSASSQQILMPASKLQTPHIEERWRSVFNTAYVIADLGSIQSFDTVCVFGMTVGDSASIRLRASATDSAVESALLEDSGELTVSSAYFDPDYGAFVYPLDAAVSARYIRVDLSDPDGDYVEAGRMVVTTRTQFDVNFTYGWSIGRVDRSSRQEAAGGQTLTYVKNSYRILDISFDAVSSSQRFGIVETVDLANGHHYDVLLIVDPESANIARDTIWGLVENLTPITQAQFPDIYGKNYRIKERL